MVSIFKQRIISVQNRLKDSEVLLVFAADHKIRNRDVEYKFRQDSTYYYLTGIEEPSGILVLEKNSSCIFCLPKEKEKEIWTGYRIGKNKIKKLLDLDQSFDLSSWETEKEQLLTNKNTLFHFFGDNLERDTELLQVCSSLRKKLREGKFAPSKLEYPNFIHEMRMKKTKEEIEQIKHSVEITRNGHLAIMKSTQAGMFEYEIEAILEQEYLKKGAWGGGYGHIVAGGANATVLHYTSNNKKLKNGELVLVDSGAEKNYYTADVTRVFPVGKQFTSPQKDIYEIVLAAQKKAIAKTTKGTPFIDVHLAAVDVLVDGLLHLNLLKGSKEDILENKLYFQFYMHRTGHYLGMDVHDVGTYYIEGESRKLENGFLTTVEPGLYFDPSNKNIPKHFRGIGVRIEDNILVNGNSPQNLTHSIPKEIKEIEEIRNS